MLFTEQKLRMVFGRIIHWSILSSVVNISEFRFPNPNDIHRGLHDRVKKFAFMHGLYRISRKKDTKLRYSAPWMPLFTGRESSCNQEPNLLNFCGDRYIWSGGKDDSHVGSRNLEQPRASLRLPSPCTKEFSKRV